MTREGKDCDYGEMTNEEYLNGIYEILKRIESNRILRYFYIFISEKMKRAH